MVNNDYKEKYFVPIVVYLSDNISASRLINTIHVYTNRI